MTRYVTISRIAFGWIFVLGGLVHLVLGRIAPDGYAAFGDTAAWSWLENLWATFVMPNIGWLTAAVGVFELVVGVALLRGGAGARIAAVAALVFFAFILVLGYGFPTGSVVEDLLKNRVFTALMAALLLPVVISGDRSASGDRRRTRWARRSPRRVGPRGRQ